MRFLHDGVNTRFSRYQIEDDEDTEQEQDDVPTIFPKIGHPIGKEKNNKRKGFVERSKIIF